MDSRGSNKSLDDMANRKLHLQLDILHAALRWDAPSYGCAMTKDGFARVDDLTSLIPGLGDLPKHTIAFFTKETQLEMKFGEDRKLLVRTRDCEVEGVDVEMPNPNNEWLHTMGMMEVQRPTNTAVESAYNLLRKAICDIPDEESAAPNDSGGDSNEEFSQPTGGSTVTNEVFYIGQYVMGMHPDSKEHQCGMVKTIENQGWTLGVLFNGEEDNGVLHLSKKSVFAVS